MEGKIALEEHWAIPETLQDSAGFVPGTYWDKLQSRLLDVQDRRLKLMDEHGIETMILSLNAPAVQAIPTGARQSRQRGGPTTAGEGVRAAARPVPRLRGAAAAGPRRCSRRNCGAASTELGFVGALVNGFSQDAAHGDGQDPLYYDLPQYRPFWARSQPSTSVLPAPPQPAPAGRPHLRGTPCCSDRPGRSRRRPRSTHFA